MNFPDQSEQLKHRKIMVEILWTITVSWYTVEASFAIQSARACMF